MAVLKYNAVIKYAPAMAGTYHNISNPVHFIQSMVDMYDVHTIFFYDAATRQYVGYWKRNKPFGIHK